MIKRLYILIDMLYILFFEMNAKYNIKIEMLCKLRIFI